MISTTKLYLFILLVFIFGSCVNNSDEIETDPPRETIEINEANILGKWELFFWTKQVVVPDYHMDDMYRYTDLDGFTSTFEKNGVYVERNVWDMETTKNGRYTLIKGKDTNRVDSIRFNFTSLKTGEDSIHTGFFYLYDESFVNRVTYHGTAGGNINHLVEDLYYYRNMERAPNYYPSQKEFKKRIIAEEKLLGTWEFYLYEKRINLDWIDTPASIAATYGSRFMFSIEGGERIFREYLSNGKLHKLGYFKIIDDVVSIKTKEINGKEVVESFALWIRGQENSGNQEIIIDGFTKRDISNVLTEIEDRAYYKRVG